jgi:HrpA-like RNA helicase
MSNIKLPVYALRDEIVSAIKSNSVVIIKAETGAGKSTQIPQYLLQKGYNLAVTQPRRLAANTVATRVAEEYCTPFGEIVGFRTAYERKFSAATRCLFVTDGLALVRELMDMGDHDVLVVDEVHEWNLNIETLVAWAQRKIQEDPNFKIVLMSATLEAERLSDYFNGAPIISVPGRTFPVEEYAPREATLNDDVARLLREGHNVLVFQPGKKEIRDTIDYLTRLGLNAEILPLHGELTQEEQALCFRAYGRPKCVVSTNVAQTSVTIPDIDAVVDSGTERRVETVDGIEGLYLRPISLADSAQRKGRAGRTKSGVYIDWCPEAERPEFPTAEILRLRLDQVVLQLAAAGIDMEGLRFFHQPDLAKIRDAYRVLVALGCMDKNHKITPIGRRVAKMPVSVRWGRMIVEAEALGVVDDIITVAAILEQGGINAHVCPAHQKAEIKNCTCWQQLAPEEMTSDVIAQLLAYQACEGMSKDVIRECGISVKAYYQAKKKRRQLADALKGKVREHESTGNLEDILRAICASRVDYLFNCRGGIFYSADNMMRELTRGSVVAQSEWLVGEPFDLEFQTRRGPAVLHLVRMATAVNPDWLAEIAPHLVVVESGINPHYDQNLDEVVSTTETWFNGQLLKSCEVIDSSHPDAARLRREGRNSTQWQNWTNRPRLNLPDPYSDRAVIPEILVCSYGTDIETGGQLIAYGVAAPNRGRYSTDSWFVALWTQNIVAAEASRTAAIQYLEAIQAKINDHRRLEQLTEQALTMRDEISNLLMEHDDYYSIDQVLRRRLAEMDVYDDLLPSSVVQLSEWITQAEMLIKETRSYLSHSTRPSDVSDDALAALAARFSPRR